MSPHIVEKQDCSRSHELVAYLYGELETGASHKFEDHLADCAMCIDEFALLADARFSVFEWNKEEFATMPTPAISIPYDRVVATAQENSLSSILAGLWAALAGSTPRFAITAASVLILLGGVFIGANYVSKLNSGALVSTLDNNNSALVAASPSPDKAIVKEMPDTTAPVTAIVASQKDVSPSTAGKTARKVRSAPNRQRGTDNDVNMQAVTSPKVREVKSLRLNPDADEVDGSLRLAELLDTVDTRL